MRSEMMEDDGVTKQTRVDRQMHILAAVGGAAVVAKPHIIASISKQVGQGLVRNVQDPGEAEY